MLEIVGSTGCANTMPSLTNNRSGGTIMAIPPIILVPPRVKDHAGERFGRLTVLGYIGSELMAGRMRPRFLCLCDCGAHHTAQGVSLTGGMVKSCGCLASDNGRLSAKKYLAANPHRSLPRHGMSHKPEHNAWAGIKQRCLNPKVKNYGSYGGRGITVCERWRDSFEAFLEDMGPRPSPRHSLDRIDNDGPYAPGNVRWATPIEQGNNKRDNHLVRYKGRDVSLADAERLSGISQKVIRYRANAGWLEGRLFAPIRRS